MSHSRSRHRLVAVLAAIALGTVACGGGDDGKGAAGNGEDTDGSTPTTSASGDGSSSTDGTDGSTSSDPPTAGVSDAATVPLQLTGLEPNEHGAPLPGHYFYDVAGTEAPVELSVRDVLGDQDADSFDRTGDLGQLHIEKEGSEARANLVQWTSGGLFLNAEQRAQNTTGGLQEGAVCDYQPDLLLQPGSFAVGATWNDKSTCSATHGDITVTRERTLRGEVMSASTAEVDGRTVETLRIKRVTDTTTTSDTQPPLVLTEHRELTIEWIVASGLAARIDGTVLDTVSGAPKPPRTYTWTLRSVTPVE